VSFYSLGGGVRLQFSDYYWLFTLQVDRVSIVNCINLSQYVLSEVIKEWYYGKRTSLANIDILFAKNGKAGIRFDVENLLKKVKYK
ncbi:hypothetical protein GCK32_022181, partial [Trichostrongylus colubriformis]